MDPGLYYEIEITEPAGECTLWSGISYGCGVHDDCLSTNHHCTGFPSRPAPMAPNPYSALQVSCPLLSSEFSL